jgi:hypothetical protein
VRRAWAGLGLDFVLEMRQHTLEVAEALLRYTVVFGGGAPSKGCPACTRGLRDYTSSTAPPLRSPPS